MSQLHHIARSAIASIALLGLPSAAILSPQIVHAQDAATATTAMDTFKTRHAAVTKLVKKRASNGKMQSEIDQLLDYDALAKRSLGGKKRFAERCEDRCDEFKQALSRLIRENYLRIIRNGKDHDVVYLGQEEGRRGAFRVKTQVTVHAEGAPRVASVDYVMRKDDSGIWVVQDIITDDVSLSKTYRYSFNQLHKEGGITKVIDRIHEKLAEIEKKN